MAAGPLSNNDVNYWRTALLILNVGTPVLRKLLHTKVTAVPGCNNDLNTFLNLDQNRRRLTRLNSRVFGAELRERVYPAQNGNADIETWDITLLCVVLKETNVLSRDELTHVDALRVTRNDTFAHRAHASLEDDEFEQVWSDTVGVIDGLLKSINDSTFTTSIRAAVQEYRNKHVLESEINDARSFLVTWKDEIRDHLINQYNNNNNILPVAPLFDGEGLRITELYTDVVLYEDVRRGRDSNFRPEENQVTSYQEIFQRQTTGEPVKLILLKGPAGRGKSSYCTRMANVWVSAAMKRKAGNDVLYTDDEAEMLKFDFVFLVALRFLNEYDSAFDMVNKQLFEEAPRCAERLEKCFNECNCLLILDGLDEWTSPTNRPLPSTEKLNWCTRILSTRPWRQYSIPTNMDIRILKIGIMNEHAIETLATKILANYYNVSVSSQQRKVNNFMQALRTHSLDSMAEIPLILTYLVCLWMDEHGLEESKTVNYGGLLESLIRYVDTDLAPHPNRRLPGSLSFRKHCYKYSGVLYKLAEFAFISMVGHDQPTLVFNRTMVEGHFQDSELHFFLKNGLLSQSTAPGSRANDNVIVQFFHKSVQEFLVALYVSMSPERVLRQLQEQLTSIDQVLAMSNVLIFISGLKPKYCNALTKTISEFAQESTDIQNYRKSLEGRFSFRKSRSLSSYRTVKDVQGLVLQCMKECSYNKRFAGAMKAPLHVAFGTIYQGAQWRIKPTLYDFVIKETSDDDTALLLKENAKDVKSLYIDCATRKNIVDVSNQIQKSTNLQRLHLDQIYSGLIYQLKERTLSNLQSLSLVLDNLIEFPDNMVHMRNLKALALDITARHPVIESFLQFCKTSNRLEEIDLERVRCSTHRGCDGCGLHLDISANRDIKRLSIQEISVEDVSLNRHVDLEAVFLSGWMSNPSAVIRRLNDCRSLRTLILGDLFAFNSFRWSERDIQLIAELLPQFTHLNNLHLLGMAFGENTPVLNTRHLETINIEDVTLNHSSWRVLLRSLVDIPENSVSGLITTREDGYPRQLIRQVSPRHFTNVNISVTRNRAVIRFETIPSGGCQDDDGVGPNGGDNCDCAIHQAKET